MYADNSSERRSPRSAVFHYLYSAQEPCTKATLAKALGLSLPTIYQSLNELAQAGLVRSSGEQQSTGGRRAQGFQIVADAQVAVGISITESSIRMVLADLQLHELAFRQAAHCLLGQVDDFARMMAQELEDFLDENHVSRSRLLGVGIALPAVLSPNRSRVILAPTLGLRELELDRLVQHIPYPAFWENDATCGGHAEWFIRGGRSNMAYISLEDGVGGAVMIGGAPYLGSRRRSGEFGHMCVEPAGLSCRCGKRGCLEAYCSARRISDTLGVSLSDFFDGLGRHIPEYEALWHDLLRHLAIGINNIRMALDCDVVLGGFLTEYLPPYLPLLQEYLTANNAFPTDSDYVELSVLRRLSVPLGVALHYVQEFLDSI